MLYAIEQDELVTTFTPPVLHQRLQISPSSHILLYTLSPFRFSQASPSPFIPQLRLSWMGKCLSAREYDEQHPIGIVHDRNRSI